MRLGIVLVSKPYSGGAFTYASFMLEAISRNSGNDIERVAYYTDSLWEKYLTRYDNLRGFLLNRDYQKRINELNNSRCDIILISDQLNWCRDIIIPTITPIHDLMHIYERGHGFNEIEEGDCFKRRQLLYSDIYAYSAGILTDSELGREQVLDQYGRVKEDRVYSLPFSVPFYLDERRDVAKVSVPKKYIFYPAQFWKHKNHEALVKAVAKLKDKGLSTKLVFVGSDKGNLKYIEKLISDAGVKENINILGFVPDNEMYFLYKNARAMIMPSIFGPTNIPPLEAMYVGCPVAVSNLYAMPEQVGDAGLLFNPYDIDEVSDVLERLWCDDNLCAMLAEKGREQVKQFSIEKFAERLMNHVLDVYEKENAVMCGIKKLVGQCREKNVYIYGAGEYARDIFAILNYFGVQVKGFLVSEKTDDEGYLGLKVHSISSYEHDYKNIIVLGLHQKNYPVVYAVLKETGISQKDVVPLTEQVTGEMWEFLTTLRGKTCFEIIRRN